jgi:acyl-CoA reductase-like NAD-dependent aldehyde dehydrogenase
MTALHCTAHTAAKKAFRSWSVTPYAVRAAAMLAFADALDARAGEFAEALSKEQGKPMMFAMGEVKSTVKKVRVRATCLCV